MVAINWVNELMGFLETVYGDTTKHLKNMLAKVRLPSAANSLT